ncbi:MAG: S41 family peptidase [Janthinobacterium lividum]
MQIGRILGRVAGTGVLLGAAFIGGVAFNDLHNVRSMDSLRTVAELVPEQLSSALMTAAHGQVTAETPYDTYADVLATLKGSYYGKDIDSTQMTYNAIRGMMGATKDRYTRFLDPKGYKDMQEENNDEFVGIGALLGTNPAHQVYVVKPLPNSPAIRGNVMAGDIILKVNNTSTLKLLDSDVVKLIRGEANTPVMLTMQRHGVAHPVIIHLVRAPVHQEVVQYLMVDPVHKIGYISLSSFNEESDIQVGKALTALQAQGMKGLVFDLRENGGGLLDIAREIASRFIPDGPVYWLRDRTETANTLEPTNVDTAQHRANLRYPLAVLVNGDSASASEVVSGAIKDTEAGVLVGEKTFGKGIVQTIQPLPDGSAVLITTQHYYTAHKNDIHHKGIVPNVVVTIPDADLRKDATFRRLHPEAVTDVTYDTQLQAALAQVRQKMQVASAHPW